MQGASRWQGPSLAKRRNAADALSRGNPKGRVDSGRALCRESLAVNDTAARLASRAHPRIDLAAGVKIALTGPGQQAGRAGRTQGSSRSTAVFAGNNRNQDA